MTPEEIKRLDELHAISTSNHDNRVAKVRADSEFFGVAHHSWPAISAELTRLREFEAAVRKSFEAKNDVVRGCFILASLVDIDRKRAQQHEDSLPVDQQWIEANGSTLYNDDEIEAGCYTARNDRVFVEYFDAELNNWQQINLPQGATRGDFKQIVKILRLAEVKRKPAETE